MKILSVVGNRPQFIKSGPVSEALRAAGDDEVVLHTGQHWDRELSGVFFEELGLPEPAYRLDLHTADPAAMRPGILAALERERPDWALVYGDTNSTLAGAEAAVAAGIPVAHVEAGLRSGDLAMPEERNRIAVDRISQLLLPPDERSRATLLAEGVPGRIVVVGDVMADASLRFAPIARERSHILARLGLEPGGYVVATIHREANVEPERLARIVDGLGRIAEPVMFPAHPRTRGRLVDLPPNVRLLEPLGYLDMAALASQARVIVTDSGGLQKEAFLLGIPCTTVRTETEWTETLDDGWNVLAHDLVGLDQLAARPAPTAVRAQPYGDGHAARRVVTALSSASPV